MLTIREYQLDDHSNTTVFAPKGAEFLDAQLLDYVVTLWAAEDTTIARERVPITIARTGEDVDTNGLRYLATVQDAAFVRHIWVPK